MIFKDDVGRDDDDFFVAGIFLSDAGIQGQESLIVFWTSLTDEIEEMVIGGLIGNREATNLMHGKGVVPMPVGDDG